MALRGLSDADGFWVVNHAANTAQTWSYEDIPLCLDRPGAVTVDAVRPHLVGPVTVTRAGVRTPDLPQLTVGHEPLPAAYPDAVGYRLVVACGAQPVPEIALQLRRTGSGSAAVDGLDVDYRADGRKAHSSFAVTIVLCDPTASASSTAPLTRCSG